MSNNIFARKAKDGNFALAFCNHLRVKMMRGDTTADFVTANGRNECCHREYLTKYSIAIQEEDVSAWFDGEDYPSDTDWQDVEELEVPRRIANMSDSMPAISQEIYRCRNCGSMYVASEAKNLPRNEEDTED